MTTVPARTGWLTGCAGAGSSGRIRYMLEACPAIAFAAATDLVRARRFYEGTLGLRVEDDGPFACVLRAGDVMVRVARVDRLTPQPFTVLGFDVDDIRHQVAELVQRGV